MQVFNSDFYIATHMADCLHRLKPVAFMQMTQEMAMMGAEGLGFGFDALNAYHTAWVLSRMHIHFESLPRWKDNVNLQTWHKGASGPFFLRDFTLADGSVKATSSWVVMDLMERKMVRFEALGDLIPKDGENPEHAIETPAPKVIIPKTAILLQESRHRVSYSDVDFNEHANNTRYVEWSMDTLGYDYLKEHEIRDLYINFHQEVRPDSVLVLRTYKLSEDDGNTRLVEIVNEDKAVFTCKFVFDKVV